jgi:hypothetical protein
MATNEELAWIKGIIVQPVQVATITYNKSVCSCPTIMVTDSYFGLSKRASARRALFALLHTLVHEGATYVYVKD